MRRDELPNIVDSWCDYKKILNLADWWTLSWNYQHKTGSVIFAGWTFAGSRFAGQVMPVVTIAGLLYISRLIHLPANFCRSKYKCRPHHCRPTFMPVTICQPLQMPVLKHLPAVTNAGFKTYAGHHLPAVTNAGHFLPAVTNAGF